MEGILYICGTPIGNLEDISLRQLRILKEVDLIACEDTRHTIKLLNYYEIENKLISYHEHNYAQRGPELINMLREGKSIALVSDAGMPTVSDPGADLVRLCVKNNINYTSIPGPTAVTTATTLAGISKYSFYEFFPQDKKEQEYLFEKLKNEELASVFYEAPHRIIRTLKTISKNMGNKNIIIIREMTKKYEEILRFTVDEGIEHFEEKEPRGEMVLILEGIDRKIIEQEEIDEFMEMTIEEHMDIYLNQGIKQKEAMRQVAKDRGVSRRDIYNQIMIK